MADQKWAADERKLASAYGEFQVLLSLDIEGCFIFWQLQES